MPRRAPSVSVSDLSATEVIIIGVLIAAFSHFFVLADDGGNHDMTRWLELTYLASLLGDFDVTGDFSSKASAEKRTVRST